MGKNLIYHSTRNIIPILTARALKSWFNIHGRKEDPLRRQYESVSSELAEYVLRYHARIGENAPSLPVERLANMVGDTTFSWGPDQIKAEILLGIENSPNFKKNRDYKRLIQKTRRFHHLIRNCYVYCGNLDFASTFGNGGREKRVLGINAQCLDTKDYLHAGDLVWWEIPLNEGTLREVHSEDPDNTRETLRDFGYDFVDVRRADFSEADRSMRFFM